MVRSLRRPPTLQACAGGGRVCNSMINPPEVPPQTLGLLWHSSSSTLALHGYYPSGRGRRLCSNMLNTPKLHLALLPWSCYPGTATLVLNLVPVPVPVLVLVCSSMLDAPELHLWFPVAV